LRTLVVVYSWIRPWVFYPISRLELITVEGDGKMTAYIRLTVRKASAVFASLFLVVAVGGCQTFSLDEEQFRQQQMGRYDDNSPGATIIEDVGKSLVGSLPTSH
jgi:hypothetical protein